jgi:hypothetical protein
VKMSARQHFLLKIVCPECSPYHDKSHSPGFKNVNISQLSSGCPLCVLNGKAFQHFVGGEWSIAQCTLLVLDTHDMLLSFYDA